MNPLPFLQSSSDILVQLQHYIENLSVICMAIGLKLLSSGSAYFSQTHFDVALELLYFLFV
jgi:hypothetical protein